MHCPSCAVENPAGMRFCGGCGNPLVRLCPACGFQSPPAFAFCGQCGAAPRSTLPGQAPPPEATVSAGPYPPDDGVAATAMPAVFDPTDRAERRQLTVVFCDLVGSTALSERLDPEELHALLRAYQQACAEVIDRYEGHIAQYLGDGLLIYFGYPRAHEDDARRAVRAALEIAAAVRTLGGVAQGVELSVRLGMHTGLVVVGEVGAGGRREQLALGETPNIAARLQGLAEPSGVVISGETWRLVEGYFEAESLGPRAVKGISRPLEVFRVRRETAAVNRLDAAARLTPLFGRQAEAGLLNEHWRRARAGEGRAVLVSGEAGIGKSRLVQAFRRQAATEALTRVELRCSAYHQSSALYPVISALERALRFEASDAPTARLAKLEAYLSGDGPTDLVPLLAALLSLPHPPAYPELTITPELQRRRMLDGIVAWLLQQARRQPLLLVVDDLHWADPSTLELLDLLLARLGDEPILVLLTARPEFHPPWQTGPRLARIELGRLSAQDAAAMIAELTGGRGLPSELHEQIVARTDGIPLFVEELTRMVLESGLVREAGDRYELSGPLPPLAIPTTLQDSLMARLDRLGTARAVAQLGATLGREFSYELLRTVAPQAETVLRHELARLVEAGLLQARGDLPYTRYSFRHALIEQTAYQSLLRSKRRAHHRRIAEALEEHFPELAATQAEIVAHHYTEAAVSDRAILCWQQAGRRSVARSAYQEGARHFSRALELILSLPESAERVHQELLAQVALGSALMATRGYAAPAVGDAYGRALALSREAGEAPHLNEVLIGLATFFSVRAEYLTARGLAEQALRSAERAGAASRVLWGSVLLGQALMFLGALDEAWRHLERGIALASERRRRPSRSSPAPDPGVTGLAFAAQTLWLLGYPDQALARSNAALDLAAELDHGHSIAFARANSAAIHGFRGEPAAAAQTAAMLDLAREQGLAHYTTVGRMLRGWVLAEAGQEAEGIGHVQRGLAAYRAGGANQLVTFWLAQLAELMRRAGQIEAALAVVDEGLAEVERTGERHMQAQLLRERGELLLASADEREAEAEACLETALQIARAQGARSLELRIAISLARLWQRQDRREEALQALGDIYGWFTEGFETADLREAQGLLETLGGAIAGATLRRQGSMPLVP